MASLSPPRNILIFGATGLIGSFITEAILSAKAKFGRIAIFTSLGTLEKKGGSGGDIERLRGRGVEVFIGKLEGEGWEEDVRAAYEGESLVLRTFLSKVRVQRCESGLR